MRWRIEKAKTGRSTCRHCERPIAKGEQRFGNDDLNSDWYHLRCAAAGRPRAFKPFEARAAKLIATTPAAKKAKPPPPATAATSNAELEAKLRTDPDNAELRGVFADWLQSQGDPWGELIALTDAGKASAAKRVLQQHGDSLLGGFGARTFEWKRGFIDRITVKGGAARKELPAMLKLRTARFARSLFLPMKIDAGMVAAIAEHAPPTLRKLFTWLGNPVGKIACPSIERLALCVERGVALDTAAFAPLFAGKTVPALRMLELYYAPLAIDFVEQLLDSPLVARLEGLEIHQGALTAESSLLLIARAPSLAHLAYIDFGHDTTPALEAAFGKQLAARHAIDRYDDD